MPPIPSTEARVFVRFDNEEDRFLPEGPRVTLTPHTMDAAPLVWVNIQTAADSTHGAILWKLWEAPKPEVIPQPSRPGFVLPTENILWLFVGRQKELGWVNMLTRQWEPLTSIPDSNPRTIINDAEIVPGGTAVVFGTKDTKFADPIAHLYLYTLADNRVSVLADKQVCSNGKVFASDRRGLILFDIDTPTRKVVRYRLDVVARRATPDGVAIDTAGVPGFPDGMCDCGD